MTDLPWRVHEKGSPRPKRDCEEWELSVIRSDNAHGLSSYGWPSPGKSILTDIMGGWDEDRWPSHGDIYFLRRLAEIVCETLNKGVMLT